jgi:hypothetical protein
MNPIAENQNYCLKVFLEGEQIIVLEIFLSHTSRLITEFSD